MAQKNFLFLSIDDLNDWTGGLGGYSDTVHTPNMDALMDQGTTFTNAFSQAAICNASEYSPSVVAASPIEQTAMGALLEFTLVNPNWFHLAESTSADWHLKSVVVERLKSRTAADNTKRIKGKDIILSVFRDCMLSLWV